MTRRRKLIPVQRVSPIPYTRDCQWNAYQVSVAIKLHRDGVGATQAAQFMSDKFKVRLTRSAVQGKWHRLGLKRDPYAPTVNRLNAKKDGTKDRRKDKQPRKRRGPLPKDRFDDKRSRATVATVGRPLKTLPSNGCRFTVASAGSLHLMCGEHVKHGPWCPHHREIVFRPYSAGGYHGY